MPSLKNITVFYIALLLPFLSLAVLTRDGTSNSYVFVFLLCTYLFLYRPLLCGYRLISMGIIKKSDLIRNFIPFWNIKYYNLLFFNKA